MSLLERWADKLARAFAAFHQDAVTPPVAARFPATQLVMWAGRLEPVCDNHAAAKQAIADLLHSPMAPPIPAEPGQQCAACAKSAVPSQGGGA